jgi:hypothetical protein
MNKYKIPYLNPIQFHQYGSGDFFYNTIPSFEYKRGYNQTYRTTDKPGLQVLAETSTATMKIELVDIYGVIKKTYLLTYSGFKYKDWFVYRWDSTFNYSEGYYLLKITISDSEGARVFYSEPIELNDTRETVAISYSHDENNFDIRFTEDQWFMIRLEGGMKSDGFSPGGKFKMFQDLDYQTVLLESNPFNVEKWTFGQSLGVPNYVGDKLNRIFGLYYVMIDGVYYSRNESAKMERVGDADYPLAGWTIDLVKTENPFSSEHSLIFTIPFTADNAIILADTTIQTADQTLY